MPAGRFRRPRRFPTESYVGEAFEKEASVSLGGVPADLRLLMAIGVGPLVVARLVAPRV